jgi:hypothetical protein
MKHEKLATLILVVAALAVPAAYAKKSPPMTPPGNSSGSQAGGLPATNERVAALEGAVATLKTNLAAEVAARQAADTALANQIAAIPQVFVGDGAVSNLKGATATVASKTVPAGKYVILAAVQLVNSQSTGDANARCVLLADGNLLADTTDLQFPILTTVTGPPSPALGSTMFAPLQGSYSSSAPVTFRVDCSESNGKNGGLNAYVSIAAMKAGTLQ